MANDQSWGEGVKLWITARQTRITILSTSCVKWKIADTVEVGAVLFVIFGARGKTTRLFLYCSRNGTVLSPLNLVRRKGHRKLTWSVYPIKISFDWNVSDLLNNSHTCCTLFTLTLTLPLISASGKVKVTWICELDKFEGCHVQVHNDCYILSINLFLKNILEQFIVKQ